MTDPTWLIESGLYERCNDLECPVAYAYRAPFEDVDHYHYIGPTDRRLSTRRVVLDDKHGDEGDDRGDNEDDPPR